MTFGSNACSRAVISLAAALFVVCDRGIAIAQTVETTLMQVSTNSSTFGYAGSDTNSCAIDHNNLISFGNYQYIAYYGPDTDPSSSGTQNAIYLSRRTLGTTTWSAPINSGITITGTSSTTGVNDDHDVIAMGIDPNGYMHMSWDMHNVTLNYAITTASVTGSTFNPTFNNLTTGTRPPTLFASDPADAGGASRVNEVTYPEFFNVPGTNQLIFSYRNGGAGGGSGNGNQYIDAYTPNASNPSQPGTWTNTFMVNGEQTSVNAYLNGFVYDSHNNLLTTWTWRASPAWQTNSNIMFAQSPDNGLTWYKQGGITQYPLVADPPAAIIQTGSPSALVGQVVKVLPQNTSFINQTTMTVDIRDRPIVATYSGAGNDGYDERQQSCFRKQQSQPAVHAGILRRFGLANVADQPSHFGHCIRHGGIVRARPGATDCFGRSAESSPSGHAIGRYGSGKFFQCQHPK